MPQHALEQVMATPLGGCNAMAFRVDTMKQSYFVRILPEDDDEWDEYNMKTVSTCVANTRALGNASVTAPVLASDEAAVVQAFVLGERMEFPTWTDLTPKLQSDEAHRIGAMIAAIHACPQTDPTAQPAPHCFYHWDIKAEKLPIAEPLVACWKYIQCEAPNGVGGETVVTHGDLHNKNVLVQVDGTLLAVDLELSGLGCRAFDLAFFFYHWEWFGTSGYPCFAARRAIATSYLTAANYPATDADVCDFLWEVEYVVLRVALLRTDHADLAQETRDMYMVQLPIACEICKRGRADDQDIRRAVIHQGLLPLSLEMCRPAAEDGFYEELLSDQLPLEILPIVQVH
jgi:aminoglycoside phosphotransferase (APT) family kinase protein